MAMLVTGGAGFIGSQFIDEIITKTQDKIVNLDALTYAGKRKNNREVRDKDNYVFIEGDITDRDLVQAIFKTYDIKTVVNFAAESHVDRSIEDPAAFIKTNVLGVQVLMDAAKSAWTDKKGGYGEGVKFLQISTDEVYGSIQEGKFTEDSKIQPNSPYSASKAAADMLALSYYATYSFPVLVTRCGNNYGTRQYPEKLIPLMVKRAVNNEKLPVYGDGFQVRDWIHVKDHCRAIFLLIEKGRMGQVYNIGGDNEVANMAIVKAILKETGKDESLIAHVADRKGHDRRYAVDHTKITQELGWQPQEDFKKELIETIRWYMNQ